MSRYVSDELRALVSRRAGWKCEYCKLSSEFSYFRFHVEHIISIKHGGKTIESNLAFACPLCNLYKGTDIGTEIEGHESLIRFYNPRIDNWNEHFVAEPSGVLSPKSAIGMATIKILNLNHPDSIIERRELLKLNLKE
jgi:hypothetical protein